MCSAPSIVWLRHDLRLADNPALQAAAARRAPLIPIYILCPEEEGVWIPGGASRWWLHQSLASLQYELKERGSRLILCHGKALPTLEGIIEDVGAVSVFWNRRYEPSSRTRDEAVATALRRKGLHVATFNASLLFEPDSITTLEGRPYKVFTPFWRACLRQAEPTVPQPEPQTFIAPTAWPKSLKLATLGLEDRIDWAGGLRSAWTPGTMGAVRELNRFLDVALDAYIDDRNRPDRLGTSRLSPHLHFGEISPRMIWHAVQSRLAATSIDTLRHAETYLSEIGWREFAYYLLNHFPHTTEQPLRPDFKSFPWREDAVALNAWCKGRTGYPIVDAGMRELWETGWMHNRLRMIVASFLVKDLFIPWQQGARWFWDTLVDADLASNTLGWQWTAGCGADAAPFFRIFNPVKQGETFDPQGTYICRYVPELRRLPDRWIHQPWKAPKEVLTAAGVTLGETYPAPIVDHAIARAEALRAYKYLKSIS